MIVYITLNLSWLWTKNLKSNKKKIKHVQSTKLFFEFHKENEENEKRSKMKKRGGHTLDLEKYGGLENTSKIAVVEITIATGEYQLDLLSKMHWDFIFCERTSASFVGGKKKTLIFPTGLIEWSQSHPKTRYNYWEGDMINPQ